MWITTKHGKFLKDGTNRPSYLLPNQDATETDMKQLTGSKLGKDYIKAVYCHPAYFYAEYIMQNTGLDESQAGTKIARRNINNLRYGYSEGPMLQSTGLQRVRHDLMTEHLHHPRMLVRAKYKKWM